MRALVGRLLGACVLAGAMPGWAQAQDLDRTYPKGSITTPELAEKALADALAVRHDSETRFKAEIARCAHVILKNECKDKAQRLYNQAQNRAHRVEVEAHDLQRAQAAQKRAAQRAVDEAQQRKEEAERPEKERQAHVAAQKRQDEADQRTQDAQRQEAQAPANREKYEHQNAQHDLDESRSINARLRAAPEKQRQYEDKQKRAADYAKSRAQEREKSEKDRAERQRKRDEQMAQDAARAPAEP